MESQPNQPPSSLTKAFLALYLAFASASAIMLLWLLLRLLSYQFARETLVVPALSAALVVTPIILMFVAKIAGALAYRRDVRASERST